MPSTVEAALAANVSIVLGSLAREPERRELPSGESVLGLEVAVRPPAGPQEIVPVVWYGAPVAADRWSPGEQVLVTGRTRRRFFQSGGITQSRTEVVAAVVLPTRKSAAVRSALDAAADAVRGALDP